MNNLGGTNDNINEVRSIPSPPFPCRFENTSLKRVTVYWVNYSGEEEAYAKLWPTQFVDVNTYEKHYWRFRDNHGNLHATVPGGCLLFSGHNALEKLNLPNTGLRQHVLIMPRQLCSLRSMCVVKVSEMVKSENDLQLLSIPKTLKKDILIAMKHKCLFINPHCT